MNHTVTLIPGDGIGPEVTAAARRVIDAACAAEGAAITWETAEAGETAIGLYGEPLPARALESVRKNKTALKGPITTPVGTGFRSVNVGLRAALDLYAGVRPARSISGIPSRYQHVDIVVVRENTEDVYAGVEHMAGADAAECIKIITRAASTRIARHAFNYAAGNGRKKVTAVHKANIMKLTDGLFLECARECAKDYPGMIYDEKIIDALCMDLVIKPEAFDILLCPNLYGDILSDLCAGLTGGLGLAPSANVGGEYAVFEAVHGSAPDIAGQDKANPTALLLSGALMLRRLNEHAAADRIERALYGLYAETDVRTPDLGGRAGTEAFTEAVIKRLNKNS